MPYNVAFHLLQPLSTMALLLFPLRGVPDDEAAEVRELLTEQQIDFYETSAGHWGVSMPALWLKDRTELEKARQLIGNYQQQRYLTARQDYLQRKQSGQHKGLRQKLIEQPLTYCAYLLTMGLVTYASIRLLFELGL